ncbi:tRNA lysidine(34) synthetase TilS [Helicobacter felis]|uniref:tRNA lysidine(34) synthetase TilS n=1 Tax=Helicobacter felis TaxID=214 RepID=UPI000CEDDDC8|nr:tRNA lysidine(34) synthetase TilS [Helicobacter felis]
MRIVLEGLEALEKGRGLLGFSGGGDSVALFHLLLERGLNFDLAIFDHGLREQAHAEIAHAKTLGKLYQKRVHVGGAKLSGANLEAKCRKARYEFFENVMDTFNYTHLILAHHLNDKLEWLLMQLGKGASLQTLLGFSASEKRKNYHLIRPLIYTPKSALLNYLHRHKLRYFEDSTNSDLRFKRNLIRHTLATPFLNLSGVASGLVRSFKALEQEKHALYPALNFLELEGGFVFKAGGQNLYYIDRLLKKLGYLLSHKQRLELEKRGFNGVFVSKNSRYIVGLGGGLVYVVKTFLGTMPILPKVYKEACRLLKVPPLVRPALFGPEWTSTLKTLKDFQRAQSN